MHIITEPQDVYGIDEDVLLPAGDRGDQRQRQRAQTAACRSVPRAVPRGVPHSVPHAGAPRLTHAREAHAAHGAHGAHATHAAPGYTALCGYTRRPADKVYLH